MPCKALRKGRAQRRARLRHWDDTVNGVLAMGVRYVSDAKRDDTVNGVLAMGVRYVSDAKREILACADLSLSEACVSRFASGRTIPREILVRWIEFELRMRAPTWADRTAHVVTAFQGALSAELAALVIDYSRRTTKELRDHMDAVIEVMTGEFRVFKFSASYAQTFFPLVEDDAIQSDLIIHMLRLHRNANRDIKQTQIAAGEKYGITIDFRQLPKSSTDTKSRIDLVDLNESPGVSFIVFLTKTITQRNDGLVYTAQRGLASVHSQHPSTAFIVAIPPMRVEDFTKSLESFDQTMRDQYATLHRHDQRQAEIVMYRNEIRHLLNIDKIHDDIIYPSVEANSANAMPWAHNLYTSWLHTINQLRLNHPPTTPTATAAAPAAGTAAGTDAAAGSDVKGGDVKGGDFKGGDVYDYDGDEGGIFFYRWNQGVVHSYGLRLVDEEGQSRPVFDGVGLIHVFPKTKWRDLVRFINSEDARIETVCGRIADSYDALRDLLEGFKRTFPYLAVEQSQTAWYNYSPHVDDIITTYKIILRHQTELAQLLTCFRKCNPLPHPSPPPGQPPPEQSSSGQSSSGFQHDPVRLLVVPHASVSSLGYRFIDNVLHIPANLEPNHFDPLVFSKRITTLLPHLERKS